MPPNVDIVTKPSLVAPITAHYDEDEVFSWEQVYHFVCKY